MIGITPAHARASTEFPLVPGDDAGDALTMYENIPESTAEQGFLAIPRLYGREPILCYVDAQ